MCAQAAKFPSPTEDQWTQGTTFSLHLWWHEALLQLQLGNTQAALDLYDNTVGPRALKGNSKKRKSHTRLGDGFSLHSPRHYFTDGYL